MELNRRHRHKNTRCFSFPTARHLPQRYLFDQKSTQPISSPISPLSRDLLKTNLCPDCLAKVSLRNREGIPRCTQYDQHEEHASHSDASERIVDHTWRFTIRRADHWGSTTGTKLHCVRMSQNSFYITET
jgi:hypothetical protein